MTLSSAPTPNPTSQFRMHSKRHNRFREIISLANSNAGIELFKQKPANHRPNKRQKNFSTELEGLSLP